MLSLHLSEEEISKFCFQKDSLIKSSAYNSAYKVEVIQVLFAD